MFLTTVICILKVNVTSYRACKSRGLVFILKTSGALRLSLEYFNVEIPIQKVKFVFEDVVDEQFAELSKKNY